MINIKEAMDNRLTPRKIERLMNLAQGCPQLQSFVRRDILNQLGDKQLSSCVERFDIYYISGSLCN